MSDIHGRSNSRRISKSNTVGRKSKGFEHKQPEVDVSVGLKELQQKFSVIIRTISCAADEISKYEKIDNRTKKALFGDTNGTTSVFYEGISCFRSILTRGKRISYLSHLEDSDYLAVNQAFDALIHNLEESKRLKHESDTCRERASIESEIAFKEYGAESIRPSYKFVRDFSEDAFMRAVKLDNEKNKTLSSMIFIGERHFEFNKLISICTSLMFSYLKTEDIINNECESPKIQAEKLLRIAEIMRAYSFPRARTYVDPIKSNLNRPVANKKLRFPGHASSITFKLKEMVLYLSAMIKDPKPISDEDQKVVTAALNDIYHTDESDIAVTFMNACLVMSLGGTARFKEDITSIRDDLQIMLIAMKTADRVDLKKVKNE